MQRRLQAQRAASGAESPHVVGYRREHRPTDLAASLLPGIPSFDQPALRCADATPHGEAGVRLAGPAPAEATPHAVYGHETPAPQRRGDLQRQANCVGKQGRAQACSCRCRVERRRAADCARVAQQQQVKYHYDARVAAMYMFQP